MTVTIRTETMSEVFTKFHLEGLPCAAVLHRFTAADEGDPHDHPWPFRSFIISGGYRETVFGLYEGSTMTYARCPGDSFEVPASRVHRIETLFHPECWTLIVPLPGPHRTPGFYRWVDGVRQHRFWHETEWSVR